MDKRNVLLTLLSGSILFVMLIMLCSCEPITALHQYKGYQKEVVLSKGNTTAKDTCYRVNAMISTAGRREIIYEYNGNRIRFRQTKLANNEPIYTCIETNTKQLYTLYIHSMMGYDSTWLIQVTPQYNATRKSIDHSQVLLIGTNQNICR